LPDNGSEFIECIQTHIFKERGIEIRHGAPRTPQTQGGIESFHKFLESELVKYLGAFLSVYRNTKHSSINTTPFEAMFGRTNVTYYTLPSITPEEHTRAIRDNVDRWLQRTATRMISNTQTKAKFDISDQVLLCQEQTQIKLLPHSMYYS